LFVVLQAGRGALATLHRRVGLNLVTAWVTATVLFVLVPHLAQVTQQPGTVLAAFAVVTAVYVLISRLNVKRIEVESAHLTGLGTGALSSEPIETSVRVRGTTGVRPHVFGILLAWVLYRACREVLGVSNPTALAGVSVAVYAAVILLWARVLLAKRFSPRRWQARLNERRERLKGVATYADLSLRLGRLRRGLAQLETGAQLSIIAGTAYLLRQFHVESTSFPAALVVVMAASLVAVFGTDLIKQAWKLVQSGVPAVIPEVDPAMLPEPVEEGGLLEKIKAVFQNRIARIMAGAIVVMEGLLLLRDFIKDVWKLLSGS
jgi:hypothetical protein